MDDFVLSAFSGHRCEYRFDRENVRFTLYLDSGLFQSEDCNQYTNEQMHSHPYYEWFFVTNGSMRLTTAEQTLVLKKNEFVLIRPGVGHYINFLTEGTTRYNLNFSFEANGLESIEDLYAQLQNRLGHSACIAGAGTQELADINRRISQLCGTNRRTMICACFAELITAVQDILGGGTDSSVVEEFLRNASIERRDRLHRLFDSYYMYSFTVDQVADCLGISSRQLGRIIRQEYGCTYHERISYMRACSARQLLAKTDFTVGEIAHWVGYSSQAAFYAAFKNQFGCLPTEYRKKSPKNG